MEWESPVAIVMVALERVCTTNDAVKIPSKLLTRVKKKRKKGAGACLKVKSNPIQAGLGD